MQINNIGYNHYHDADFLIQRPQGSGDYLALLIRTPAIFTFDGRDIITEPNSFLCFKKGTPQLYRAYGSKFGNDWFHFDMTDEDMRFLEALSIPFDKVVPIGDLINALSLLVKNMCHERYSQNLYRADTVELYMKIFFIKLGEKLNYSVNVGADSYREKVSMLRSQIYNMPYNDWSVEGLAHQLTMSKSYCQHLYKEIFGISVMQDVIRSRIEHSKYLLATTDISVAGIAEICGYKCELHFMRQFKARMKMTPTEFRQSVSGSK